MTDREIVDRGGMVNCHHFKSGNACGPCRDAALRLAAAVRADAMEAAAQACEKLVDEHSGTAIRCASAIRAPIEARTP